MRAPARSLAALLTGLTFSLAAETDILCTTLPVTALTNAVVQNVPGFKVTRMLSSTIGCPHDYALTPQDMRKLAKADVIVVNGLGMEASCTPESTGQKPVPTRPTITITRTEAHGMNICSPLREPRRKS